MHAARFGHPYSVRIASRSCLSADHSVFGSDFAPRESPQVMHLSFLIEPIHRIIPDVHVNIRLHANE